MEKADISTLEKPDISILVLQSDLSFGYLSAELKSPVKIPIPDEVKDLRSENRELKEEVAEITLRNRILKKSLTGHGEEDDA